MTITHIITLATCHNRREATLAALGDLHRLELPEAVTVRHVIVDDGSTDGTADAVRAAFPDVEIVEGSGDLYWAGGMRFGWERAVKDRTFDYLFVYNDDGRFDPDALQVLLDGMETPAALRAITGAFRDPATGQTSYGGFNKAPGRHPLKFSRLVEPDGTFQRADTLNMNGVLISRGALDRVGFLSHYFVHSGADFEFGLKLRKAGGDVLVAPRHIGTCARNPASDTSPEQQPTLRRALVMLFDKKRDPIGQRFAYYRRHGGALWPLWWVSPYITIWFRLLGRQRQQAERQGHNAA